MTLDNDNSKRIVNVNGHAAEEYPASIIAKSNLRCPSPPPILNKVGGRYAPTTTSVVAHPDYPYRETIKAGGAYLKDKNVANGDVLSPKVSVGFSDVNDSLSPTTSTVNHSLNPSNDSLLSLDYTSVPPENPTHRKQPSMHAHFYVDEALRPTKRSRSGSNASDNTSGIPSSSLNSRNNSATSTGVNSSVSASKGEQNANIDPRLVQDDGKIHVLLGVCGALSTIKIKLIINKLFEIYTPEKLRIQLILTKSSEGFISQEIINILENVKNVKVWRDSDEWITWKGRSDPVLHIELRRWADILVVCPLTANTLSKISLGLCDNLLTNVIRAWNTAYPILLAPAMVSYAYNAISTKRQIKSITEEMPWIEILKPVEKVVGSYGDIGMGGMMDWNEVVNRIVLKLGGYPDDDDNDDDKNEEAVIDDDNDDEDNDEDNDDDDEDDDDEDEDDDDDEDEQNEENYDDLKEDISNLHLLSDQDYLRDSQLATHI